MKTKMKQAAAVTCVFLDVGGVLLTNGWDHLARKRAAKNFKLDWAEMEERHRLTFETHEEGKLTFEEYLGRVVFYQKRPFTRAQFKHFMFAQSKPYPEMIELFTRLKIRHGLKIAVVSNESREVNAYRIRKFKLERVCGFFYFLLLRPSPQTRRGHLSACVGPRPDASPASTLHRKHADVRPDRGRFGDSKHSSHGLQVHLCEAGFVRIAERRRRVKPANPCILTINGGSSSIKFALYQIGEPLKRRLHGKVDRIGLSGTNLTFDDPAKNQQDSLKLAASDHKSAASFSDGLARRAEWFRIGPCRGTPRGPRHATHRARASHTGIVG